MCEVTVTLGARSWVHDTGHDESEVMRAAAQHLLDLDERDLPATLTVVVDVPSDCAMWKVAQRGTYIKGGVEHPSVHATCTFNHLHMPHSDYDPAYLVCVNPESNNYKFYWMQPQADGIHARYGRVGGSQLSPEGGREVRCPYDPVNYWVLYYEKLSKGYTDETATYLGDATTEGTHPEEGDSPSSALFDLLASYARGAVRRHVAKGVPVTRERVDKVRSELDAMRGSDDVGEFNAHLTEVLRLSPRRVGKVGELLAGDKGDLSRIIGREEDLLAAMEGLVLAQGGSDFDGLGVHVFDATDRQVAQVMRHMDDATRARVTHVWRVRNSARQAAFDAYVERRGIECVRLLWHGSTNQNWLSIVSQGQRLHPNAAITGKMFGDGLYFAPDAKKSLGYTSLTGSYWARGTDANGFMALVAVAVGRSEDTTCAHRYTAAELDASGHDSVWAHAGSHLYHDEVIVYDEDACVIDYLVEFE